MHVTEGSHIAAPQESIFVQRDSGLCAAASDLMPASMRGRTGSPPKKDGVL
jgi:hypothetical protein